MHTYIRSAEEERSLKLSSKLPRKCFTPSDVSEREVGVEDLVSNGVDEKRRIFKYSGHRRKPAGKWKSTVGDQTISSPVEATLLPLPLILADSKLASLL